MPSRTINRVPPGPDDPRHGQYRGYIAGCRLACCVAAERRYQRERNRRQAYGQPLKVPSIGTVRRLQALMALGWTGTYLADRLGLLRTNLPTHTRYGHVRSYLAQQVAKLYDELHLTAGPSERTRRRAEVSGFLPPESWEGVDIDDPDALPYDPHYVELPELDVDEVAVQRRLAGDRVRLNALEQREAVRRALEAGVENVALTLGMNSETVRKIQEEIAS